MRDETKTLFFGSWPQGEQAEWEPIEWLVFDEPDGNLFLLTRCCIDGKPFHGNGSPATWETSELRAWLNGAFLSDAFGPEERARIVKSHVVTPGNERYGTAGSADTLDSVFLLSLEEVERLFPQPRDRMAPPTRYMLGKGVPSWWWLRSPGAREGLAARVTTIGAIREVGDCGAGDLRAVRPALRLRREV